MSDGQGPVTARRTVTVNHNGKSVISNLRVPFQRGSVVWVQTSADKVIVTVEKPEEVSDGALPPSLRFAMTTTTPAGTCAELPEVDEWSSP